MFANLHLYEIIVIILIIVIVFGGKRLPELGKGLGKGLRNFRKGLSGQDDPQENSGPKESQADPSDSAKNGPDRPKA
ncbi:MAG: twin-arginine translocase TatA/TatE family subunit [Deltaproteobacteria bacterium]|jgi:sec-independent protein translocase protein TatA|nr:twin-arginine translocase TatA/TatE family subunit [Deltaproteobacteria bacterium]